MASQRVPFYQTLQPAQYGGLTIYVRAGKLRFGRRNALHEYPFRDTVWVEDLGRQARRIQLAGFLIGDGVIGQLTKLIAACESPTTSELVHPLLGRQQVALMDCETGDSMDDGRIIEVTCTFIQQGTRKYPSSDTANGSSTAATAATTSKAVGTSFQQVAGPAMTGPASNGSLVSAASDFAQQAVSAAQSATALVRMSAILESAIGAVLLRLHTGVGVDQTIPGAPKDIRGLIGQAAIARQNVADANGAMLESGGIVQAANIGDFSNAAFAVCEAVRASAATPGDAVAALANLAQFTTDATETGDALTVHLAAEALMQRMAAVSLVLAASSYQPQTVDDAIDLRNTLVGILNPLIDAAGDGNDDTAFQALRSLRTQIVLQLNTAGAALPGLVPFTLNETCPALVLAQRLYRDASRADELVARSGAINPTFLPPSTFPVLTQ